MNRSTGLLRAYAALLRRVSGAETVSLYAPSPGEGSPIFLAEGGLPLPEHTDVERAHRFAVSNGELAHEAIGSTRIESEEGAGWLTPVECTPFARTGRGKNRRRGRDLASDFPLESARTCWIGLRFPGADFDRTASEHWTSLLSLGGVLAWYAAQISSILDDPVTGLAGRAEFQASLKLAFEQAKDADRPLCLLFINPDDFTSVNERFGHEAGDRVLREIGERLRGSHRSSDTVAKYGGAIFASFLPDTDAASGRVVAEKIWSSLADAPFVEGTLRLGISVGLAAFDPQEAGVDGHLELIRRADKALNGAKRYGGDHVMIWESDLDSRDLGSLDRMTGVYTGNMAKDYRNMTLLSDTMTVIAGSSDLEDLVEQMVDRLSTTLKPDHVGIFDWDEEGEPVLIAGLTRLADESGGHDMVPGLELTGRKLALLEEARREGRALLVSSADDSEERVLSFAVPLLLNDLCLGALYLDGRANVLALEGSADLGFLRAFGTQLAVALDRARLSQQQRRQHEREQSRLRAEVDDLRRVLNKTKLVYRSGQMEALLDVARRVAPTKATVLLIGESGTGKELVARTIHELSPFQAKPLVVVDCGAIPTTLIESELFGHERGAYTGAQERRIGRLLEAEGGTVVLDEIGELPLEVQSKLLRFVQERQIVPVGGTRVRHVDTRLIAVTNRELAVEAAAGRFREDLFYRLNVVRITVPPLRERPEDILHLAEHFLEHFARQYQKEALSFSVQAREALIEHTWPGNVRELSNRIMQAVILSERAEIGRRELELEFLAPEQTVEMDLTVMKRAADERVRESRPAAPAPSPAKDRPRSPQEAWDGLRAALRRQVMEAVADGTKEPVPLGTWLIEDLVLSAYEAASGVSGRARALLGVPETTFRRKLSKAMSQERAGLLTRRPPWSEVGPSLAALVRSSQEAREDVLETARSLLLREVTSLVQDPVRGAALMGVTLRTYRRWIEDVGELARPLSDSPLAPAI